MGHCTNSRNGSRRPAFPSCHRIRNHLCDGRVILSRGIWYHFINSLKQEWVMYMCIYGIRYIKLLITLYFHVFVFLLIMCLLQYVLTFGGVGITENTISSFQHVNLPCEGIKLNWKKFWFLSNKKIIFTWTIWSL